MTRRINPSLIRLQATIVPGKYGVQTPDGHFLADMAELAAIIFAEWRN